MSCKEIHFDGARDPERCKCQGAVLRTYTSLISAGRPHPVALEAAEIVYRYHHPEDSKLDAALTVERWIHAEQFH
ncbi:MAG: hypothetical protein H6858_04255 [Rhodospirillales bacterium]|nr:hypothetical protein [Alphaproteobacteria bacterium]MCB1841156.1 hypothetical protein [Alphaproteobacteria bacterium]MCB9976797.1 hypothetical protein [Rhodospirillales bacterium]